ncbi:LLM class flavin-dependent oxidoreductase [Nocardia brasiliensis]|uniref:LLM class flavin-dependent oxidoreductase n=1 Tax=Nocardia brasiliensis TaxID=37326 RepID=UPI0032AF5BC1
MDEIMALAIGVILPTSTPDPGRPILGDVRGSARFAEGLGLESVWSTDHLVASAPMLDSTVVVATAAAVTERIKVGYNVMLLALRPTAWAAKQVSSLQHVSGDRLLLGVGTGNPAHGDIGWRAAGFEFGERGRRTDEALRVLPALIAGEPAAINGVEATLSPGAVVPPILVAGNGSRARRRAAEFADGWITLRPDVADLPREIAESASLAEEFGRSAPKVTVVAPDLPTDLAAAADHLAAHAAAGVERVILAPTGPDWQRDYEFAAKLHAAL